MNPIRFEWDERKNRANGKKHGVSFSEAQTAFYDEQALLMAEPIRPSDEERFVLLGLSDGLRLVVISHCYREADRTIRIISARRATKSEMSDYESARRR